MIAKDKNVMTAVKIALSRRKEIILPYNKSPNSTKQLR